MSERVARLAVSALRALMFPQLPSQIQQLFPMIADPLIAGDNKVPNIVVGEYEDFGSAAGLPMITIHCDGAVEGMVNVYRHLTLTVDIWTGAGEAVNVDGRRVASTIYQYVFQNLQNTNWSGNKVEIARCYEVDRSKILFEPESKIYHIANLYRVEALSAVWY